MTSTEEFYQIADELRAIACQGLHFEGNRYVRVHFEHVLEASARLVAAVEQRTPHEVLAEYRGNLAHLSPLVGAEAAVYREGKLLLIRREDDGLWALPGGLTEVGETASESACRELREEAGLHGQPTRLLGIFDSRLWRTRTRFHLYTLIFEVECGDPTPVPGPETAGAGFFGPDSLPALSPGHDLRVPFAFRLLNGEVPPPYFDGATQDG